MVVLADSDAHTLVGEASREECGFGHAREGSAWVGGEGTGDGGHDMDGLALDELKEGEAQAKVALCADGDVAKDKEASVGVVDVFEAIEGGDDGTGEGAMCGRNDLSRGIIRLDEIAAHEEIWALEVIPEMARYGHRQTQRQRYNYKVSSAQDRSVNKGGKGSKGSN